MNDTDTTGANNLGIIVKTKMGKSKGEGSSYVYWRFDNCTESLLYELEQL